MKYNKDDLKDELIEIENTRVINMDNLKNP